ncbi:MAG TPA: ATP12 family protein [Methylocystis sp.]|nr:ATP12 family protein [Methylocystis sp.]
MSNAGDGFEQDVFVGAEERKPVRSAPQPGEKPRVRRFFKEVATAPIEGGFAVLLDGRSLRTPARVQLILPTQALAEAVAQEWAGQGETLDPASMPLTKMANSAIDGVAQRLAEVEADAVKYAESDLVCYRAGEPQSLKRAEAAAWDPLVRFARETCGARLSLVEGVMFQQQPRSAVAALADAVRRHVSSDASAPFRLAALHALTTLSGSLVIALAVALGEIDAEAGFTAAQVDEDHQMRQWGADAEALAGRERRRSELLAAAQMGRLLRDD